MHPLADRETPRVAVQLVGVHAKKGLHPNQSGSLQRIACVRSGEGNLWRRRIFAESELVFAERRTRAPRAVCLDGLRNTESFWIGGCEEILSREPLLGMLMDSRDLALR